jgi:hypothetical protein
LVWCRIYHLREHPEDITEEERKEAIDAVIEDNKRIQYDLPEVQKEREEGRKTYARIKTRRLMRHQNAS